MGASSNHARATFPTVATVIKCHVAITTVDGSRNTSLMSDETSLLLGLVETAHVPHASQ
jgi:hypothetical protein